MTGRILGVLAITAAVGCQGDASHRGDPEPDLDARGAGCDDEPEDPLPAEDGEAGIQEEADGGALDDDGDPSDDGDDDEDPEEPVAPEDGYLVGDWDGDDVEDLALRRDHCVLREWNRDGVIDHEQCFGNGDAEDEYLVGDWNGDGKDDIAVRRDHCLVMDWTWDGTADAERCYGNGDGDDYIVGDWNGDGIDDLAVRRAHCLQEDWTGDGIVDAEHCYGNGDSEDEYLVGDWNADGPDDLAVRRDACVSKESTGVEQCFGLGDDEDEYLVGDWNADGVDDLAVRRGHCVLQDTNGDGAHDLEQCLGNGTAELASEPEAASELGAPVDPELLTLVKRFDVATLDCGGGQTSCPADDPSCFCKKHFDVLNSYSNHYLGVAPRAGDAWQPIDVAHEGDNRIAYYVNDFNKPWREGQEFRTGTQWADDLMESIEDGCGCNPRWLVINEISAGRWVDSEDYRNWVLAVVRRLGKTHRRKIVLAAPFPEPGKNGWWWSRIEDWAYIGIEGYLSGRDLAANGYSEAWAKARYQAMKNAYAARGVRAERMMLIEHFGNTGANDHDSDGTLVNRGRTGLSKTNWKKAITARTKAARAVGFAGFLSYAWGKNAMGASDADRTEVMQHYASLAWP